TVHLTDDALFECPFLVGSDVGTIGLAPVEVTRLREYLLKGGFLWVDDFWGTRAWEQWSDAMREVLPEYPIFDIPADHPIRSTLFEVIDPPQAWASVVEAWTVTAREAFASDGQAVSPAEHQGADSWRAVALGVSQGRGVRACQAVTGAGASRDRWPPALSAAGATGGASEL